MKRFTALVLTTACLATLISGCSKTITNSDPTAVSGETSVAGETTAAVASSEATDATASASETTIQTPQTFEELYGNQLMNYMDHQYYFEGEPIALTEANFYFVNGFMDLSNYANMGYYPMTSLQFVDLASEYSGEDYDTMSEYFIEYCENSIETTCILCARAEEENVTLSEETLQQIEDMITSIRDENAANSGMSLDEYLQLYYGPGMNEEEFRSIVKRFFIADVYSKNYCDNYEFTDEEKYIPNIRYALFYAPESAEQADKDAAYAEAVAMKDACKSIDDISGLAAAAQEEGKVYDQGDITVSKGQTVQNFEDWAFGEGRTEGEMDVIYDPTYGYFLVGYIGLVEQEASSLQQVALKVLSDELLEEVKSDIHDFHTDDEFAPAPAAPTATPMPENPESTGATVPAASSVTGETNADGTPVTPATGRASSMSTADVLIVVFFTLAGVAILAVIVILIRYAMNSGKKGKNGAQSESKKKAVADVEPEKEYTEEEAEEAVKALEEKESEDEAEE